MGNPSKKLQSQKKIKSLNIKPGKEFWQSGAFVRTIDLLAQRYGRLPSDIVALSMYEFNFNVGVMSKALEEEKRIIDQTKAQGESGEPKPTIQPWSAFGIAREVRDGRSR